MPSFAALPAHRLHRALLERIYTELHTQPASKHVPSLEVASRIEHEAPPHELQPIRAVAHLVANGANVTSFRAFRLSVVQAYSPSLRRDQFADLLSLLQHWLGRNTMGFPRPDLRARSLLCLSKRPNHCANISRSRTFSTTLFSPVMLNRLLNSCG